MFPTPRMLIDAVGGLDEMIKLKPKDENEWDMRHNKNLYRPSPSAHEYLYNFIVNTI